MRILFFILKEAELQLQAGMMLEPDVARRLRLAASCKHVYFTLRNKALELLARTL